MIASIALLGLLLAFGVGATAKAQTTSWQTWYGPENRLVVHVNDDSNSAICFDGKREDYSGFATSPKAETSQYSQKQNAINSGLTYVDQEWLDFYTK